jgi:hypothetical protein
MKHTLLPLLVLGARACRAPDSEGDAAPARADAVAETELPVVRYYVIGDT